MATAVTFNGTNFSVPAYGDSGWAQGTGNLSSYLVAIASGCLQTTGGTFTLSAPVNFGASNGIIAVNFTSISASPATTGVIRLASGDSICFGASNYALTQSAGVASFNGTVLGSASNHSQSFVSQTSVTVTHNLGHYPIVQVLDNNGNLIDVDTVNHGSVNAFTISFGNLSVSGTIIWVG